MATDADRISQLLNEIRAGSVGASNLSVIDTAGEVIASTDTDRGRIERVAVLLPDLMSNASSVSGLTARGNLESVTLRLEDGFFHFCPITTAHVYMVEWRAVSRLGYPDSASPHLAVPALRAIFEDNAS